MRFFEFIIFLTLNNLCFCVKLPPFSTFNKSVEFLVQVLEKTELFLGEINTGHVRYPCGKSWVCSYGLGDLLLCLDGTVRLSANGKSFDVKAGSLVLVLPVPAFSFHVISPTGWEGKWAHFKLDGHLEARPEWYSPVPGFYVLPLPEDDPVIRRFYDDFEELAALDDHRASGWYQLFYSLLEVMILRGNMFFSGKSTDRRMIEAGRMLKSGAAISDCIAECNMSRAVFFRSFHKAFGISPKHFQVKIMLRRASMMLQNTERSIAEIAEECGFCNSFYFSSRFRKFFGCSPSEFRKNLNLNDSGK